MATPARILIVGAGIVGQTLAIALAKRGVDCEIVELKENFEILGAGMIVQGTALRAYLDIGLVEELAAAGWHSPDMGLAFLDTLGNPVMEAPVRRLAGDHHPDSVVIRRQALHEVLNRNVNETGVQIRMALTVDRLSDRGDAVDVTFSDGSTGSYDTVIGCDGIRSRIRELVCPGVEPEFAGFCNWRMILPRLDSLERPYWMWGHGKTIGILPVDDDQMYVAGVGKVATPERPPADTIAETFRKKFACFGAPVKDVLQMEFTSEQMVYTVMEQVKLPPPWFKGRIVVMGDAAHAACPFWAQGASMGIEDAIAFAQELEKSENLDAAIAAWFDRRYERATFVQQGSFETGQHLTQDEESDEPKIFPEAVREVMAKNSAEIGKRLAEPF